MKKIALLGVIVTLLSFSSLSAGTFKGFGLQYGFLGTYSVQGLGFTAKFGTSGGYNLVTGLSYSLDENNPYIAGYGDIYAWNEHLSGALYPYVGVGVFMGAADSEFTTGIRFPIGIQFIPVDAFEFYAELVPGVALAPEPAGDFGVAAGFRIRFN